MLFTTGRDRPDRSADPTEGHDMAMFHEQSTPRVDVAHDEASLTSVAEADDAPDATSEPQTACEPAGSLPPFRSRVVRVPNPARAARVDQA